VKKGLVMLVIHIGTVICVSQLPETKGSHMGAHHVGNETEDLVLTQEVEGDVGPSVSSNISQSTDEASDSERFVT
jgi:hypothetical protein